MITNNRRGLNQAEHDYTTTKREALVLVKGIKKSQPYLQDHKFIVYTNCSSQGCYLSLSKMDFVASAIWFWCHSPSRFPKQWRWCLIKAPVFNHQNERLTAGWSSDPWNPWKTAERSVVKWNDRLYPGWHRPSNVAKAKRILLRSPIYISQDALLYHLDCDQKHSEAFSQLVVTLNFVSCT